MNILSPKHTFLSDAKVADAFQEHVMTPAFKRAVELAFCQFVMQIDGKDVVAAPKIDGAKEFIHVLLNFGDRRKPITQTEEKGLKPV